MLMEERRGEEDRGEKCRSGPNKRVRGEGRGSMKVEEKEGDRGRQKGRVTVCKEGSDKDEK